MNRKLLSVCVLVGVPLAIAAFYLLSGRSPEEKRDLYLKGGREYITQSKINEAVIMFKNAVQIDPAYADSQEGRARPVLSTPDGRAAQPRALD